MIASLPIERHAVFLLVVTLEDVGEDVDAAVAAAHEVDVVVAVAGEVEEMDQDILEEKYPPPAQTKPCASLMERPALRARNAAGTKALPRIPPAPVGCWGRRVTAHHTP